MYLFIVVMKKFFSKIGRRGCFFLRRVSKRIPAIIVGVCRRGTRFGCNHLFLLRCEDKWCTYRKPEQGQHHTDG